MMHFRLNSLNCAYNFVAVVKKENIPKEFFVYESAGANAEPYHCFVYVYVHSTLCSHVRLRMGQCFTAKGITIIRADLFGDMVKCVRRRGADVMSMSFCSGRPHSVSAPERLLHEQLRHHDSLIHKQTYKLSLSLIGKMEPIGVLITVGSVCNL